MQMGKVPKDFESYQSNIYEIPSPKLGILQNTY